MSDDFDLLLKKLNEIQWDTLTSMDNLPGSFIVFIQKLINLEIF